jgi:ABC-type nitrate/sulfonate/bicarbonate transport system substrate-binding protein
LKRRIVSTGVEAPRPVRPGGHRCGFTVADAISPSYFVAIAAVQLGFFKKEHPDIAAGAVRAIVKTQRALRAEPQLAARAAQRLFPGEEASLIAFEVTRDLPFYDATITEEMVAHASRFAREMGVLEGGVRYGELVATQFAPLWRG